MYSYVLPTFRPTHRFWSLQKRSKDMLMEELELVVLLPPSDPKRKRATSLKLSAFFSLQLRVFVVAVVLCFILFSLHLALFLLFIVLPTICFFLIWAFSSSDLVSTARLYHWTVIYFVLFCFVFLFFFFPSSPSPFVRSALLSLCCVLFILWCVSSLFACPLFFSISF